MTDQSDRQPPPAGGPMASADTWDLVADGYAVDMLPAGEKFARDALELARLPPAPHVVDVATGPGTLALLAARQGATVSAIDFSPAMIANLNRRAVEVDLELADVRVGDGQDLPYGDKSFDGGFSMAGLVFFPDRHAGFRELYRVLRPGRRAVVSGFASIEGPFDEVLRSMKELLPDLPAGGGDPPLGTPEAFEAEMSAAGFRSVDVHARRHSLEWPSLSDYWQMLQRSAAPVALLRKKMGEESWIPIAHGVLERLENALGGEPVIDRYTVLMGVGVR